MYEENRRGTLRELIDHFKSKTIKGEIVIVVEGVNTKKKNINEEENDIG
jgi:16S rRNA (cytidine1402-2'-O)-methyltransferase